MKAKIFTLLTLMVMTCMSLTSMAQEPVFILVEEDGNQITQPSQDSSFSFSQEVEIKPTVKASNKYLIDFIFS